MTALVILKDPPKRPQPGPDRAEKTRSATDVFMRFAQRQVDLGLAEWCETSSGEMGFRWLEQPKTDSAKKGERHA